MNTAVTLFLIIFLEGYIVLSVELLAIRQMVPFVGTGTDTVSIIIAAVLMPLAFGYYVGGHFKPRRAEGYVFTIRKKLLANIAIACLILTIGLSYSFIRNFTHFIHVELGQHNTILITTLYALLFLVTPVYLLGQTVPLISNYFSRERLSKTAGKILFFSTLGSFMGAVICTLVFMTWLGVHNTVNVTIGCLLALSFILAKTYFHKATIICALCLILSMTFNSDLYLAKYDIVQNNAYNLVQVQDAPETNIRLMRINHSYSSGIDTTDKDRPVFPYAVYIDEHFIQPISDETTPVKSILVIGGGGFTLGHGDKKNRYIFVDIDPDLKDTTETYFLEEDLGANKEFVHAPARGFLEQSQEKFDLVILDAFRGPTGSPDHLVTREFFQQTKNILKPDGILIANLLGAPGFTDAYSRRLDNTINSVFQNTSRQIIGDFNGWKKEVEWRNVIYVAWNGHESPPDNKIYTDNKNSVMFDKGAVLMTLDE